MEHHDRLTSPFKKRSLQKKRKNTADDFSVTKGKPENGSENEYEEDKDGIQQ